jgi:hypothetical protein
VQNRQSWHRSFRMRVSSRWFRCCRPLPSRQGPRQASHRAWTEGRVTYGVRRHASSCFEVQRRRRRTRPTMYSSGLSNGLVADAPFHLANCFNSVAAAVLAKDGVSCCRQRAKYTHAPSWAATATPPATKCSSGSRDGSDAASPVLPVKAVLRVHVGLGRR